MILIKSMVQKNIPENMSDFGVLDSFIK